MTTYCGVPIDEWTVCTFPQGHNGPHWKPSQRQAKGKEMSDRSALTETMADQIVELKAERDALKYEISHESTLRGFKLEGLSDGVAITALSQPSSITECIFDGGNVGHWDSSGVYGPPYNIMRFIINPLAQTTELSELKAENARLKAKIVAVLEVCKNGPPAYTVDIRRHIAAILEETP